MTDHVVLRVIGKLMIPFILLYGLYVQAHGDFGPGGGFQAGVIVAAGIILYGLIHGVSATQRVVPARLVEILAATGVLVYASVGSVTLLLGGNFLAYGVLDPHDPAHGQHLGVFLVELGVGVAVASVMLAIFYAFAARAPLTPGPGGR